MMMMMTMIEQSQLAIRNRVKKSTEQLSSTVTAAVIHFYIEDDERRCETLYDDVRRCHPRRQSRAHDDDDVV